MQARRDEGERRSWVGGEGKRTRERKSERGGRREAVDRRLREATCTTCAGRLTLTVVFRQSLCNYSPSYVICMSILRFRVWGLTDSGTNRWLTGILHFFFFTKKIYRSLSSSFLFSSLPLRSSHVSTPPTPGKCNYTTMIRQRVSSTTNGGKFQSNPIIK